MNTTGHHAGHAPRLAAIALGIALLASCSSTDTASDATAVDGGDTVIVANGNTKNGSAARMTDVLRLEGFSTGEATDSQTKVDASIVYYSTADGAKEVAQDVATVLGGVDVLSLPNPAPTTSGQVDGGVLLLLGQNEADKTLADLSGPGGTADSSTTTPSGGNTAPPVAATGSFCTGGKYADNVVILEGETLAAVAARVGRTEAELQRTNQYGTNGRPEFGSSLYTDNAVIVPCVGNWPQNTTFFEQIDPATCDEPEGYALRGLYTVQPSQDAAAIAGQIGIALDRLRVVNPDIDLDTIQPGDRVGVCQNWFS